MFEDRTTRERITHEKIDELYAYPVQADPGVYYAKQLRTFLHSRLKSQVPTPLRSRHRLVSSLQRKLRWIRRILYLVLIPELLILQRPLRSSRMPQRLIAARSLKLQRVSSFISRQLRLVSRRSLKVKVTGRLCLTLGVSHFRRPVDLVLDWGPVFWRMARSESLLQIRTLSSKSSDLPCQS